MLFDKLESQMGIFSSALVTALGVTLVTYPLDLAQGRMTADMSKKPTEFVQHKAKVETGIYLQQ